MTPEDIVPSLELCRQIPKGKFDNSALVWWGACVYPRLYPDGVRYDTLWHKKGIIPAPTLQEIIDDIAKEELCPGLEALMKANGEFVYSVYAADKMKQGSAAEAALKLWLELV